MDPSTEERIKEAARRLFMQQGFEGTKTRDIAKEAGINLALMNYYFRSKQNLFDIIMMEHMRSFIGGIALGFNDTTTSFDEKIAFYANAYIDLLTAQPDLPLFIMTALRSNPALITEKLGVKKMLLESHFMQQFAEEVATHRIAPIPPMQFVMNLFGLTVFPFIARPFFQTMSDISTEQFNAMMQERKHQIPLWIHSMLEVRS
ncbi:TetR/AcrR family transcriptional regulator [soil metagenome]